MNSAAMRARVEELKRELVGNEQLGHYARGLVGDLKADKAPEQVANVATLPTQVLLYHVFVLGVASAGAALLGSYLAESLTHAGRRLEEAAVEVADLRAMLAQLHAAYRYPVEIEFALNVLADGDYRVNLLQCRPLQVRRLDRNVSVEPPANLPRLFEAQGAVIATSPAKTPLTDKPGSGFFEGPISHM